MEVHRRRRAAGAADKEEEEEEAPNKGCSEGDDCVEREKLSTQFLSANTYWLTRIIFIRSLGFVYCKLTISMCSFGWLSCDGGVREPVPVNAQILFP